MKEKEKEQIMTSIKHILEQNMLLTLSTLDKKNNQPCSSTAYYVFDNDLNLYFWTSSNAIHSKNIKQNPKVAVNIFDSSQKWGTLLKGLQMFGKCRPVNNKELLFGGALYLKRFPKVIQFVKKIFDFNSKKLETKMYKITINKIKVFDEKVFGKEEFREIIINNG
ncbi:pyridoxamine 5'-phosphate oxidase family protein [Candidatus Woesearchaeota archaeon]|nr:pyridoxamine 5'-phosphate oxidase family protein [Candidatus Woesearchaeota archaeon]